MTSKTLGNSSAKAGINTVAVRVATTLYSKVVGAGKLYRLLGTNGVVNVKAYRMFSL